MPQIHTIVSLPFEENTYVVWQAGRRDALVIDPGLEPDLILAFLQEEELTPAAILNTHGHADHIGGNAALKHAFPQAPLLIGFNEAPLLTDAHANLSAPFGFPIVSPTADRLVREGDVIEAAGITRRAMSSTWFAARPSWFLAAMCCSAKAWAASISPAATASCSSREFAKSCSRCRRIRWSIPAMDR